VANTLAYFAAESVIKEVVL